MLQIKDTECVVDIIHVGPPIFHSEEKQPADNVETLCENMQFYPPELYLTGDDLLFDYDGKLISDCLASLNAKEVNVFVMAKEFREAIQ